MTLFKNDEWLNDCVIDAFMKMLNYKHSLHKYQDNCYFHGVSLYNYLSNNNYGKLSEVDNNNSRKVAKYPGKNNFFSYDRHLIPINWYNKHWSMCVIDLRNCIVYNLDSISNKTRHETVCNSILKCVQWELNDIDDTPEKLSFWSVYCLP